MTVNPLRPEIRWAVEAAQDKQAVDITVLKLAGVGAFAEYFLLCSGQSQPQIQAIGEAIEERLRSHGIRFAHREGKPGAEWVLLDYGDFVVHIFSERARQYYDLERLVAHRRAHRFPRARRGHPNRAARRTSGTQHDAQRMRRSDDIIAMGMPPILRSLPVLEIAEKLAEPPPRLSDHR